MRKCRRLKNVAAPSFRNYHILELGAARFFILAKLKVPLGFLCKVVEYHVTFLDTLVHDKSERVLPVR